MFVMGGSVVMGLVIFCVLLIVNFIVIKQGCRANGRSGRAFRARRHAGKAAGHRQRHGRRRHRPRRGQSAAGTGTGRNHLFFGSLDGASKFVKGDAIAGAADHASEPRRRTDHRHERSMTCRWAARFETYSILTVGDGLVSQIPAVINRHRLPRCCWRAADRRARPTTALLSQLGRHPSALATVAVLLAIFRAGAGPAIPALRAWRGGARAGRLSSKHDRGRPRRTAPPCRRHLPNRPAKRVGDLLDIDDIHVEFAPDLVGLALDPGTGLDARHPQHARTYRARLRRSPARNAPDRSGRPRARDIRDPASRRGTRARGAQAGAASGPEG